jgi:hypothetical protein
VPPAERICGWLAGRVKGRSPNIGSQACSTRVWLEGAGCLCTRAWTACPEAGPPLFFPRRLSCEIDADHCDLRRTWSVNGTRMQLHCYITMKMHSCQTLHRHAWFALGQPATRQRRAPECEARRGRPSCVTEPEDARPERLHLVVAASAGMIGTHIHRTHAIRFGDTLVHV